MTATVGPAGTKGYANRCLPLLMANQLGWNVVSDVACSLTMLPSGRFQRETVPWPHSGPIPNFGQGIITWPLPWTLETPPGWDVLIVPPANLPPRLGVSPMSGLVETDHGFTRFTINWLVDSGTRVDIAEGDLLAQIVPFPTDQLDGWTLLEDDEVPAEAPAWFAQRNEDSLRMNRDPKDWPKRYWDAAKRRKLGGRSG